MAFKNILAEFHGQPLVVGDDLTTTNQLIHAAKLVRLQVIDHIIINTEEFSSFGDDGIFETLEQSDEFLTAYMKDEKYKEKI